MHGCTPCTVAADALVLKHQAISIRSADQLSITWDQFQIKIFIVTNISKWNQILKKKRTMLFKG